MRKTFPYRKVLPYATEDSESSLRHLKAIVSNLYAAIKGQDLRGVMGLGTGTVVVHWTRELRSWLKLKHEMPLEIRIKLTKCYYSLALAASDTAMLERFVNIVVLLWKNRVVRSSVAPDQVNLDWRRLLTALKKLTAVHTSPCDGNSSTMHGFLARLCFTIRPLIPAEAVETLLSEIMSVLSVTQPSTMISNLNIFVLMFPNFIFVDPIDGYSAQDLLPTLFHVWRLLPPGLHFDSKAIELVSIVAQSEVCRPNSSYGPYGILNHEQMASVFSGILRLLDVPVSGRSTENRNRGNSTARHAAAVLVSSLSSYEESTHSTLDMLESLIHTVESFTHPSSSGSWTFDIIRLVSELVEMFTLRWNIEAEGESQVPKSRHLTKNVKHRFVTCILNTVFYGIYSKSKMLSALSVVVLQQLAYLEPDLILPRVLSLAYSSIQGLNETHRRITSLSTLTHTLRIMAKHPKYAINITTLLELAIPCIDANDMAKTVHALALFQTAGLSVPFVDISGEIGSDLASNYLPELVSHLEDTGELLEPDSELVSDILRSTSFAFNEIASSLLDRLFLLLENMPENSSKTKQSPEYMVVHNLPTTLMAVLNSVSFEIYERLFVKVLEFVTSHVIHAVTDTVAHICGAFVRANPSYAFPKLFGMLDTNIRYEVTENKAGCYRNSNPRDRSLIWYLSIYNMILAAAGSEILTFKEKLLDLTLFLRDATRGQTVYHTSNTIHHAIVTLISTYVTDFNFVEPNTNVGVEHWGYQPDPQNLDIKWHAPSLQEVEFAVELYERHISLSMTAIRALLEQDHSDSGLVTDFSDKISYNLIYIRTSVSAIAGLIDHLAGEPMQYDLSPEEVDPRKLWADREYPVNYFFESRDSALYRKVHEIRFNVGSFLMELYDNLWANHKNDVTSFKEVLFVLKVWFSDVGHERSARIDHHHRLLYEFESRFFQIPGLRKKLPRTILARRALLYHQERIVHNSSPRLPTQLESELLERLVKSAFSVYPDIRRHAEAALYASLKVIIRARDLVYPSILKLINEFLDEKDFKSAESGFRLLNYRTMSSMMKRDQRLVLSWLETVLRAVQADNHHLNAQAFETFNNSASETFRLDLDISHFDEIAIDSIKPENTDYQAMLSQVNFTQRRKRSQSVLELDKVISVVTLRPLDTLHWRAALVSAIVLLHLSSYPGYSNNPDIMRIFSEGILSSHPDIRRLCLHGFSRISFNRYFRLLVKDDDNFMRLDAPPLDPLSQILVDPPVESSATMYLDVGPQNPSHPSQALPVYGWLVWPNKVPVQDPNIVCKTLKGINSLNKDWLELFFNRQCVEPGAEEDQFDIRAAIVWGQIISQCDDRTDLSITSVLEFIDSLEIGDRNWHRAVSELVYGCFQAMPFLELNQRHDLLSSSANLMRRVLDDLSHENLGYWLSSCKWGYLTTDPNRIAPITEVLSAARVSSLSGLKESFKLSVHTSIISTQGWNYKCERSDLLSDLWSNLDHPLESVRSEVSSQLAVILGSRYHEGFSSAKKLLESNQQSGPLGGAVYRYDDNCEATLRLQFARLETLRKSEGSSNTESPFRVLAKALVLLLRRLLSESSAQAVLELLPDLIMPALLSVSTIRDDPDLVSSITDVFQLISMLSFSSTIVDNVLVVAESILENSLWHQKVRVLLFFQVFFLRQMFSMSSAQRRKVSDIVIKVLGDSQVEVRELAAETLSGIVRCSPPAEQHELTTNCTKSFKKSLETTKRQPDLVARHAAVLGLGALVNAYPYASPPPKWVPSVLATLAVKASSDGGLVGKSVKATLGDFKKTRQDTWHIDQLAFTADQLDDLEGVLWKNYFV
ncbi:Proteasome activator complex subunit 4 [Wickerhamiella sorbophila]|uniref:Proteasome activator complex subunit 4 n=1 Tax=Wickerhamiella sorbophila TaxID=45607 RepID=A0A2T0FKP8_9ASCO|nr:Proteasome activator complex subunit 4 [Wickerhamiella sorbophila]PRT55566.1 Proteasome activator complex subunit 4 [Wickerhamiella sorbophila]